MHSGYGFAIGNMAAFDMNDPEAVVSPGKVTARRCPVCRFSQCVITFLNASMASSCVCVSYDVPGTIQTLATKHTETLPCQIMDLSVSVKPLGQVGALLRGLNE